MNLRLNLCPIGPQDVCSKHKKVNGDAHKARADHCPCVTEGAQLWGTCREAAWPPPPPQTNSPKRPESCLTGVCNQQEHHRPGNGEQKHRPQGPSREAHRCASIARAKTHS